MCPQKSGNQNPKRILAHVFRRMGVKAKRVDRLLKTWLKLSDRQNALKKITGAALQELRQPNPDMVKIKNVEFLVKDLLADAENILINIDKIDRTGRKLPIQVAWAEGEWAKLKQISALTLAFKENYEGFLRSFSEMKREKGID